MNKRLLAARVCALTLCLMPTLARAQTSGDPAITLLDVVTTSAASTSTTTVVLIDVFVCPPIRTACDVLSSTSELTSLTSTADHIQQQPVRQRRRRVELMWRYMRENRAELELALASGAGPAVDDLVKLYRIPEHEQRAFGRRLRGEREALLGALREPTLAMTHASQFLSVLDAVIQRPAS